MSLPANFKRISLACAFIGSAGAALVLFFCDPVRIPIYPVCTFHRLTGLDCPGCGSLRAMHQLLHGHLVAALHLNAFLVFSLPVLGFWIVQLTWSEIKGRPPLVIRERWMWVYLAAWLAFGVLRDLPVPVLSWFAP